MVRNLAYPNHAFVIRQNIIEEFKEYQEFLDSIKPLKIDLDTLAYATVVLGDYSYIHDRHQEEDELDEYDSDVVDAMIEYSREKLNNLRNAFSKKYRGYGMRLSFIENESGSIYQASLNPNTVDADQHIWVLEDYAKDKARSLAIETLWVTYDY